MKSVSSWKLSLCVLFLFLSCLVVSPDLGEMVSLSRSSRSVPQFSLVMLTRLAVAEKLVLPIVPLIGAPTRWRASWRALNP